MNKPSEEEEKYFARENAERLHELAKALSKNVAAGERVHLRALHEGRCGHCGMPFHPVVFRGVKLMRCFDCGSTFLGPGELEKLAGAEKEKESGIVNDVLRIFEHKHTL